MFKMKINAKILRDQFTVISTLVDEPTFRLSAGGLALRAMDHSRVAMVDSIMGKSIFEEFVCDVDQRISFNLTSFLKLIKRTGKVKVGKEEVEEDVTLEMKDGKLSVTISGKYMRAFNMPVLEPSTEDMPAPKISFNVKARLLIAAFNQAVEDAGIVSDHVRIEADVGQLVLKAQGDLMGATITLKEDSGAIMNLTVAEPPQKATYSNLYLTEIIKTAIATTDVATLEYSKDMPMKLDFQQKTEDQTLTFFLAPRIETE